MCVCWLAGGSEEGAINFDLSKGLKLKKKKEEEERKREGRKEGESIHPRNFILFFADDN